MIVGPRALEQEGTDATSAVTCQMPADGVELVRRLSLSPSPADEYVLNCRSQPLPSPGSLAPPLLPLFPRCRIGIEDISTMTVVIIFGPALTYVSSIERRERERDKRDSDGGSVSI